MKYVLLVSHGQFAPGFHDTLKMFTGGDREDILHVNLENGMGADEYAENVKKVIAHITAEDEIIVLADIVGGSPLTNAANVIAEAGLLANTTIIGGMNLPLAISVVMEKDDEDTKDMVEEWLEVSKEALKPFEVVVEEDDDEDL